MRRLVLAVLLLASPVLADTVHLTDGRKIEGTVTHRDGKVIVSPRPGVELILEPGQVAKIEAGESLRESFEKKKSELVPGDPEPRYALALWCKEKGLNSEWREMLEAVLRCDPDHAQARRDLGYVKDAGEWITEDQLRKKLGFEKVDGKWVPAAEAKRLRRSAEIKKLLVKVSLNWSAKGKKGEQARADLKSIEADDAGLVASLVEERLGDHDIDYRIALIELLGKLARKSSSPALATLTFNDEDAGVREAAAKALWATGDTGSRALVVQALFSPKQSIRDRAAQALGAVADPETIPYLIESIYLKTTKTVRVGEDDPLIVRGGSGAVRTAGVFGDYNVQTGITAGEVPTETRMAFIYNGKSLQALQRITGKKYEYSKKDWWTWWDQEKSKLLPKKDEPAIKDKPEGKGDKPEKGDKPGK